jgi:hypothetical protein
MEMLVTVPHAVFMIDAEDEQEAVSKVEEILSEYAWDWSTPYTGWFMKHTFIVEIDAEDSYKANVVMAERLGYDEDYGFPYSVDWKWK